MARPLLPTAAQIMELPADLVRVVPAEFEDANGHMNVQHYFQLQLETMREWFHRVGYDVATRDRAIGPFTLEQHLRYHHEVLVGHEVSVHVRVVERSDKVVRQVGLLVNRSTDQLANTCEVVIGNVDLTLRRMVPFQPQIAAALDAEIEKAGMLGWPAPPFVPLSP